MRSRVADVLLLLALIVGTVQAWRTGLERGRLADEHRRLARSTGDLRIVDPTRVHVLALETGEPLHFAWRIYLPPNYTLQMKTNAGHSGTSSSTGANEFIARVRFREDDEGLLNVYDRFSGGSSRMNLGDRKLADLLRGRWDQLAVEQMGAKEPASMATDGSAVLLRLTLPEAMQAEARSKLTPYDRDRYIPVLFELKLGPDPPAKPGR